MSKDWPSPLRSGCFETLGVDCYAVGSRPRIYLNKHEDTFPADQRTLLH